MELLLSIECLKITLIYCYTSDISSFIETYCNSHYWHNCKIEILNSITQFHIYLSKQDPSWAMSVVNNSMGDIKQKYILGLIRWDQQWSHRPTVLCCANSVQHYGSALRELNTKPHKCFVWEYHDKFMMTYCSRKNWYQNPKFGAILHVFAPKLCLHVFAARNLFDFLVQKNSWLNNDCQEPLHWFLSWTHHLILLSKNNWSVTSTFLEFYNSADKRGHK